MITKTSRAVARRKRHERVRNRVAGTAERPRLAVFRSNKYIYVQAIDDALGRTLAAASSRDKALARLESGSDTEAAKAVGTAIADKLKETGVTAVVFDRGGYIYHGKVKALADAAREGGLTF
ncbi:MAG: 50S ribosomal protein L18 [Clostridiales bacterium]|jgi:large subunit ribosomal protein L18|nr:50S ribosomal protein L18 [Clostridiales bacterium]